MANCLLHVVFAREHNILYNVFLVFVTEVFDIRHKIQVLKYQ